MPTVQQAIGKFEKSVEATRLLFDLYPNPRPQAAPGKKYRAIPAAAVQSITAAFEGYSEELLATVMIERRYSWAQIAKACDMSNPTLRTLGIRFIHEFNETPSAASDPAYRAMLWHQRGGGTFWTRDLAVEWGTLMDVADGFMQVRHCLTHGLVAPLGPSVWPAPSSGKALKNRIGEPTAASVLQARPNGKHSLTLYPAVNACIAYVEGAIAYAEVAARIVGESIDVNALRQFDSI